MKLEDFAYVTATEKSFDEAVVSVLKEVEKKGWSIFNVYDVKERLAAKGFEQGCLKIIEICSAKYANKFLGKNKLISLCMPCRINIIQDREKVLITAMKPSLISFLFSEIKKEEVDEVEKDIQEIIGNSI